jgi:hypothetical protein
LFEFLTNQNVPEQSGVFYVPPSTGFEILTASFRKSKFKKKMKKGALSRQVGVSAPLVMDFHFMNITGFMG